MNIYYDIIKTVKKTKESGGFSMALNFWSELEQEIQKREEQILNFKTLLDTGHTTFLKRKAKQEAFVHESSKENAMLQFSYFDAYGAVGDFEAGTTNEMAIKILDYGFVPCLKEEFKYTLLAKNNKRMGRV